MRVHFSAQVQSHVPQKQFNLGLHMRVSIFREREGEIDESTNIIKCKTFLKKGTTKSYPREFANSFIVLMSRQT